MADQNSSLAQLQLVQLLCPDVWARHVYLRWQCACVCMSVDVCVSASVCAIGYPCVCVCVPLYLCVSVHMWVIVCVCLCSVCCGDMVLVGGQGGRGLHQVLYPWKGLLWGGV